MIDAIATFGWYVIGFIGALIGLGLALGLFKAIVTLSNDLSEWLERNGWS